MWLAMSENARIPKTTLSLIRAAGSDLLGQLPVAHSAADHLYIVDPLGNLVLRYPRDADPGRIIKDITRLLKTSRIG